MLFATSQQDVPVIWKELMLPDGFDPMSFSFKVRDICTELSGLRHPKSLIVPFTMKSKCVYSDMVVCTLSLSHKVGIISYTS
ncbi:unnamed protein product [Schistosoma mattheei]|uniref:Uncharacterized protein n=1 Tax=Schistosoma mattheei TaxID=31246 RepID=A0A183P4F6_9TREM|nr:unnamed protein product [Schistosoma mattheei]